jgi:hypothetical protein
MHIKVKNHSALSEYKPTAWDILSLWLEMFVCEPPQQICTGQRSDYQYFTRNTCLTISIYLINVTARFLMNMKLEMFTSALYHVILHAYKTHYAFMLRACMYWQCLGITVLSVTKKKKTCRTERRPYCATCCIIRLKVANITVSINQCCV